MADVTQIDDDNNDVPGEGAPVGGGRLRAAREKKKISVLEIAKELHLDEQKVRALEDNQFEILGAPVFAKGHLRKYAELVGIGDREVLADYYELTRSTVVPPVVGKRKRRSSRLSPGPWVAVLLVVVVLALFFWSFTKGPESTSPDPGVPAESDQAESLPLETEPAPATRPPANEVEPDPEPPASEADGDPGPPVVDTAAAAPDVARVEPAAESAGEPALLPAATPVEAGGQVTVSLAFAEDCWTEVTDSTGERLFFNLGRADTNVTVSGVPPLSVLLGSAYGVSITVDGQVYTISPADRRGRTARLTLP
jgi:cytoskeleton protein RodZ